MSEELIQKNLVPIGLLIAGGLETKKLLSA